NTHGRLCSPVRVKLYGSYFASGASPVLFAGAKSEKRKICKSLKSLQIQPWESEVKGDKRRRLFSGSVYN
ncbi:hypothetical protein CUMW_032490, partial [Citrus unshiu]